MFNNKKDPLIDPINKVIQENSLRRAVENAVNEHFGIQTKRQLPHEVQAEYESVLKEATEASLKEGKVDLDSLEKKKKSLDDDAANDRPGARKAQNSIQKKIDKASKTDKLDEGKFSNPFVEREHEKQEKHETDLERPSKAKEKTYKHVHKTSGKEVIRVTDKPISAEWKVVKEDSINEVSKELLGRYTKKAMNQSIRTAGQAEVADRYNDSEKSAKLFKKSVKRQVGATKAIDKLTGKAKVQANEEAINEISKKVLGSYIKKASVDVAKKSASTQVAREFGNKDKADKLTKKTAQRLGNIEKATDKVVKEETLDEVSKDKLQKYVKQASLDRYLSNDGKTKAKRLDKIATAKDKLQKTGTVKVPALAEETTSDVKPETLEDILAEIKLNLGEENFNKIYEGAWGDLRQNLSNLGQKIVAPFKSTPATPTEPAKDSPVVDKAKSTISNIAAPATNAINAAASKMPGSQVAPAAAPAPAPAPVAPVAGSLPAKAPLPTPRPSATDVSAAKVAPKPVARPVVKPRPQAAPQAPLNTNPAPFSADAYRLMDANKRAAGLKESTNFEQFLKNRNKNEE